MSDNNPLDPTRGKSSNKKAPLGDPSAPPNPSTREAVAQAGSKGGESGKGTPGASETSTRTTGAGMSGGTSGSGSLGGTSPGMAGSGTAGASGAGSSRPDSDQTQRAREELNETGEKLKSEARDTVQELADTARASAEAQAERQQKAAAGELGNLAKALRKTADEVEGQSYLPLDRFARQAAEKLDDLSESLRGSDVRTVIRQLETYTRDQPGVVLGGAIISGFLLARFIRASAEREAESDNQYGRSNTSSNTTSGARSTSTTTTGTDTGLYPGNNSAFR